MASAVTPLATAVRVQETISPRADRSRRIEHERLPGLPLLKILKPLPAQWCSFSPPDAAAASSAARAARSHPHIGPKPIPIARGEVGGRRSREAEAGWAIMPVGARGWSRSRSACKSVVAERLPAPLAEWRGG